VPRNLVEELEDRQIVDPLTPDFFYQLSPVSGKTAIV